MAETCGRLIIHNEDFSVSTLILLVVFLSLIVEQISKYNEGRTHCLIRDNKPGYFNMHGGLISNNTATLGGGVYVDNTPGWPNSTGSFFNVGQFNMFGGVISKNTAEYGGGVFLRENLGDVYYNGDTYTRKVFA